MSYTDPTDLHAQQRAADQAARDAAREAKQERDDLAWLMSGPRGRRIVWRQIDRAGVFKGSTFTPDAMSMAFAEGVRNPAMRLLQMVHAMPEFALMVSESAQAKPTTEEPHDD
jgi:uncharacterized protein (DUF849 family)